MKKLALCFIAFLGIFGSSAFADDRLYRFSQSDIDMIFHRDSAPLELAMLSPHEMQTTEGEWIQFAAMAIGAFYGAINNISYQIGLNNGWSWKSFGISTAMGAANGYRIANPVGMLRGALGTPVMMGGQVMRGRMGW